MNGSSLAGIMPRVGFAACGHSRGISGWLWFSCGVVRCGDGVVVVFVFLGIFGCVRFGVGGGGGWLRVYHSMRFRHLPNIS